MGTTIRAGDLFAGRYRLTVLLDESGNGRFWRARDEVLARSVALHLVASDDPRADALLDAARRSARVQDRRLLRVLDADRTDDVSYVVNEWGEGLSLDLRLADSGPLAPRHAAWLVHEFVDTLATAHAVGEAHGRVVPENLLIDRHGQVRVIGFAVDAALRGAPPGDEATDVADAGALLYAALTGRWAGRSVSEVPPAPTDHGVLLRPRQVQAGVPRTLDLVCDGLLGRDHRASRPVLSAARLAALLGDFVGDAQDLLERQPERPHRDALTAPPVRGDTDRHDAHATRPVPADPERRPTSPVSSSPLPPLPGTSDETTQLPWVASRLPHSTGHDTGRDPEQDPEQDSDQDTGELTAAYPDDAGEPTEGVSAEELLADAPEDPDDPINDLSWLTPRSDRPPAPDLPEPESRPLFAPEPPAGQPQRRSRLMETSPGVVGATAHAGAAGASGGDLVPPPGRSRSSRAPGPQDGKPDWPWDEPETDDVVPGRSFFRLAVLVGVLALVLLISVAVKSVLSDSGDDEPSAAPSTSSTPAPAVEPVEVKNLVVTDFDPEGTDGGVESRSEVPRATDGNPDTAWRTAGYLQNFTDRNRLKSGVGLLVDLGAVRSVSQVTVRVLGGQTSAALFLTDEKPTSVSGLEPVGSQTGLETLRFSPAPGARGRYAIVWLTSLPEVDGRYRGQIAELKVLARP